MRYNSNKTRSERKLGGLVGHAVDDLIAVLDGDGVEFRRDGNNAPVFVDGVDEPVGCGPLVVANPVHRLDASSEADGFGFKPATMNQVCWLARKHCFFK